MSIVVNLRYKGTNGAAKRFKPDDGMPEKDTDFIRKIDEFGL